MTGPNPSKSERDLLVEKVLKRNSLPVSSEFSWVAGSSPDDVCVAFLGLHPGTPAKQSLSRVIFHPAPLELPVPAHDPFRILKLEWQDALSLAESQTYTVEEQLLRERMRTSAVGITEFLTNPEADKILAPCGKLLYVCRDTRSSEEDSLKWTFLGDESKTPRLDCKWSPDSKLVSFVRDGNIWLIDFDSGVERQLTFSSGKDVTSGVAEFVMQEEFSRHTGYWWCPTVSTSADSSSYMIMYLEVDVSEVPFVRVCQQTLHGRVYEYRYPRPGQQNAVSRVRLLEINYKGDLQAATVTTRSLSSPLSEIFPKSEYVVRAGWTNKHNEFYLRLLDRSQQSGLTVVFTVLPDSIEHRIVYEQSSITWVSTNNLFHFLEDGSFIASADIEGFCHLILVTPDVSVGVMCNDVTFVNVVDLSQKETRHLTWSTGTVWGVDGEKLWVDESRRRLLFMANRENPFERHLYILNYDVGPSSLCRLTPHGFNHRISVLKDCTRFVSVFSSVTTPPVTLVYSIGLSKADHFIATPEFEIVSPEHVDTLRPLAPTFVTISGADNVPLQAAIYPRPSSNDPYKMLPVVVLCYGGPGVQLVQNDYSLSMNAKAQLLHRCGFMVAMVDGRGSANKGRRFEAHLHHKLGQVEVQDQVSLVRFLIEKHHCDPARIAITGWSYGGYLTLMCMAQRPDVFKIGIAGAPVTQWEGYDTGYTERYLGTPDKNPEAYNLGRVGTYVDGFPNERNRVVIVHGLMDENVHFVHTGDLISTMMDAGKPYVLKVFPGERHGLRTPTSSHYFHHFLIEFLSEHL